jgi:hypothetical protein
VASIRSTRNLSGTSLKFHLTEERKEKKRKEKKKKKKKKKKKEKTKTKRNEKRKTKKRPGILIQRQHRGCR